MVSKVLTLDTDLGSDALQPTKLAGQEGISAPFSYDLTMVSSSRDVQDLTNDPAKSLIGTMARIGILTGPGDHDYTHRTGIISRFEFTGSFNPGGLQDNLAVYQATVIPAVQFLGRQIAFRIFENKDVVSIINAVLGDMKARFPNMLFDTSRLKSSDFIPMEYCVQYGESTFAFLTRLMQRFGIWYIFDNKETPPASGPGDNPVPGGNERMSADNTTMVLGRLPFAGFTACDMNTFSVTDEDPEFTNKEPKKATLANFRRLANPVLQDSWFGNFNILNPTVPITESEKLADSNNVLGGKPTIAGFFQREEFPGQFENDPGAVEGSITKTQGDRNIKDYADTRMKQQTVLSSQITGATKNPFMKAGRTFTITADQDSHGEPGDYLITQMTITAFENSFQTTTSTDILNFFFRDMLFSPFQSGKSTRDFFVSGVAVAGLNNYLQNQQARMFYDAFYPHGTDRPSFSDFGAFFSAGITQVGITAAIPLLLSATDKLIEQNSGGYANTFVAQQRSQSAGGYLAPTPSIDSQPIAHGPHLAVVIGPNGVDGKQEVYADALGRVRVRFPWDPGPPDTAGGLPTPWSSHTSPEKPLKTGDNTCWVRVSEGWAGQQFGTQFLPRNGQEVLVGFIDGNPERPIIIGRIYNASSGSTNLPYPAKAYAKTLLNKLADLKGTASNLLLRTGIKTRSVPQPKSGRGFHMLRFDDTGGSEQLLLRSQGRLDVTSLGTKYETIGGDRHLTVGGKDPKTGDTSGDYVAKVFGEYDLQIEQSRYEEVVKDYQLNVKQDTLVSLEGNLKANVGSIASLSAGSIVLQASQKITLKVAGSYIVITPAGVSASGPIIGDNSGGGPDPASPPVLIEPVPDPKPADDGTT